MENSVLKRPVPRLGFGCMRLPEGEDGEYIYEECQRMFDFAMAQGSTTLTPPGTMLRVSRL
ncbi:MAG: hypothetical protein IJ048_12225 [Clostridia bacterium]|nr:hypothetical protein [Clostridia bacterium]